MSIFTNTDNTVCVQFASGQQDFPNYIGCFKDSNDDRIMGDIVPTENGQYTTCLTKCREINKPYFGLQVTVKTFVFSILMSCQSHKHTWMMRLFIKHNCSTQNSLKTKQLLFTANVAIIGVSSSAVLRDLLHHVIMRSEQRRRFHNNMLTTLSVCT